MAMKLVNVVQSFLILGMLLACMSAKTDTKSKARTDLRWMFFLEDNGERMLATAYDIEHSGRMVTCYSYGHRLLISKMLERIPEEELQVVDSEILSHYIDQCVHASWNDSLNPGSLGMTHKYGTFSGLFIYPGTKWCGPGNVSTEYDDLGPEVEADTCCREHDYCNDSIEGYESKHGLDNNSPFTKSNCRCDDDFYSCLQEGNTRASNRIGKIYFNIVESECFKKEHPIIDCARYRGWFRPTCQEYVLDMDKEPIWQFFDAKHYEAPSSDENEKFSEDFNEDDLLLSAFNN